MNTTWINGAVLILILIKIGLLAHLAHRFRDAATAAASVRRITARPRAFQASIAGTLLGIIVLAEGDAVRLHAGLHPLDPVFRATVLVGYTLLTAGLISLTVVLARGLTPPGDGDGSRPQRSARSPAAPLHRDGMEKKKVLGGVAPPVTVAPAPSPPRIPGEVRTAVQPHPA